MMLLLLIFFTFFVSALNASCPNGSIEWHSKCYFFQNNTLAFVTAEQSCMSLGGHLVSISDGFTNAFLAQNAALTFLDSTVSDFWVGGTDIISGNNNWTWTDGSNFTFTDWNMGQMKNFTGEDCLAVAISNGKWNADDCFKAKPYVCAISATPPNPPFVDCGNLWFYFEPTGYCYGGARGDALFDWHNAEEYCENVGGFLASIHSDAEHSYLYSQVQFSVRPFWIGMFSVDREKSWQWTDGSKVDYVIWKIHDPKWNTTSCALFDGSWIDTDCTASYQPLCKKKPRNFKRSVNLLPL